LGLAQEVFAVTCLVFSPRVDCCLDCLYRFTASWPRRMLTDDVASASELSKLGHGVHEGRIRRISEFVPRKVFHPIYHKSAESNVSIELPGA
jgi:hypothetical protein